MKLSIRLEAVATLVDVGKRVIDVGCDHAYLDIYLTLNNSNRCIATDINKNALSIAKKNIEKYNCVDKIETILTDGLTHIEVRKDDNIVICGMGTLTILDILKTNTLSDTLIISSNNHVDKLRKEVVELGYYIDSEIFVVDNNKPYVIIKFKKGIKKYRQIDYFIGPILKNNLEYKKHLNKKYNVILKNISRKKILTRLKYRLILFRIKFNI